MPHDIHTIAVHYSATYPDQDIHWDDIVAMHKARGFRTGGYNWFIPRDGTLEEGREEGSMTAGARGHNTGVIHICFAGGIERDTGKNVGVWNPTPDQEAQLVSLIRGIQERWPNAKTVTGHKNLAGAATQCPGRDDVAAWWASKSAPKAKLVLDAREPDRTFAESTTIRAQTRQWGATALGFLPGVYAAFQAQDPTVQAIMAGVLGAAVLLVLHYGRHIISERIKYWMRGVQ